MSEKDKKPGATAPTANIARKPSLPEGYTSQSADLVGFYTNEGAIHFIPRNAKLTDSSLEKSKTSVLIVGELVDPCQLTTSDGEVVQGKKGDAIGVWAKPGMAALKQLAGIPVFLFPTGTKDVGKPSPMTTYEVASRGKGGALKVTEDYRKESKTAKNFFSMGGTVLTDDEQNF
jgi:hypothetical protein